MTYSSWLAATARKEFTIKAGLAAVAQFQDEHGAFTPGELADADQWARHRALLARRQVPVVPAPVLAQARRGGTRQALLSRLLSGCRMEILDDVRARAAGALAARAARTDIVDACAVEGALRRRDLIISSDPRDLTAIAAATGRHLEIDHP
jgi:hypothetical protein